MTSRAATAATEREPSPLVRYGNFLFKYRDQVFPAVLLVLFIVQELRAEEPIIAPRLFRVKDDPLYGTLQCGAALDEPVAEVPPPAEAPAA